MENQVIQHKTIKQRILEFLLHKPLATVSEISEATNVRTNVVGVYLARLKKDGYVFNPEYGRYVATEKTVQYLRNRDVAHLFATQFGNIKLSSESSIEKQGIPDLESIDVILALKQKYGRPKLLEIISKIKQIIEE